MRNTKKTVRRTAVVGGAVAALLGGGIAFAAWTSTGTGSGSATAARDAGLAVSGNEVSGLFPTGDVTVNATVQNKNPYKVKLNSITVDAITSDKATCNAAEAQLKSVSAPNKTGLTDVLAAKDAAGDTRVYPFQVSMTNDASDACQGAKFTVTFTANGESTDLPVTAAN